MRENFRGGLNQNPWVEIPNDKDELWPPATKGFSLDATPDGQLIMFGGEHDIGIGTLRINLSLSFDLNTCKWTPVVKLNEGPGPRSFHSSVVHRGSIVVFGGSKFDDEFLENMLTMQFTEGPDDVLVCTSRQVACRGQVPKGAANDVHYHNGTILAFDNIYKSFHKFEFGSSTWTQIDLDSGLVQFESYLRCNCFMQ